MKVEEAITHHWGERCDDYEEGCPVCDAWHEYDNLMMGNKAWVGLTDEEITELQHAIKVRLMGTYKTEDIYRAIESKLKEKNHG